MRSHKEVRSHKEGRQEEQKIPSVPPRGRWILVSVVVTSIMAIIFQSALALYPDEIRSLLTETWNNTTVTIKEWRVEMKEWIGGSPPPPPPPSSCQSDGNLPTMIPIPENDFGMRNKEGQLEEQKTHPVHLKSFTISCHPITSKQYNSYLQQTGQKPRAKETQESITNISWQDAISYTSWFSKQTQKLYCLPTDAQWEYASRFFEHQSQIWEWTCSQSVDKKYDGKEQECLPIEETEKMITVRGFDKANNMKRGECPIDSNRCDITNIGFRVVNSEDTCPKQLN